MRMKAAKGMKILIWQLRGTRKRRSSPPWSAPAEFLLMVLAPVGVSSWYLYTRAVDQYASTLGFTVRSEDISSASDILGGLGSTLGGRMSFTPMPKIAP